MIGSSYRHLNSGNYYIKPFDTNYNKITLVASVFKSIFEYYPSYENSELEKSDVLKKFSVLKGSSHSYDEFLNGLNKIVMEFRDPHFFISSMPGSPKSNNRRKRWRNPLPLFEFNKVQYIAAVFDTTLKDQICPGDKFISCQCLNDTTGIDLNSPGLSSSMHSTNEIKGCKNERIAVFTENSLGDTAISFFKYNAACLMLKVRIKFV